MKDIIRVLFFQEQMTEQEPKTMVRFRCLVSVILCVVSFAMLLLNIKNHSVTMAKASVVLVVGFSISAIVAGIFKKERMSAIIIAVLVAFVLSIFAIAGGNEGFAILWILLVPLFSINILGITPGFLLSTYFMLFLLVLFYTDANGLIAGKYSASFVARFPVLYFSDYVIATVFSIQREYYYKKLKRQVYSDGLTGAYNRRFCMAKLEMLDKEKDIDYAVVAIDLNGLKIINDTLGHDAGDELIQAVVECCKDSFDKMDIICRMGGDEYVVIAFGNKEAISKKVIKLKKCMEKWSGKLTKTVSFAVGCAYSKEGVSGTVLLKKADEDMYHNKMLYYQEEKNDRRK